MLYLLDTNVCIDIMRGRDDVISRLRETSPDDCAVSTITTFELLSGCKLSAHPERETEKVCRLIDTLVESPFDDSAAERAAEIRAHLQSTGKTIGSYDTLIAGHALSLGLGCVTDNVKEYSRVEGLQLENWRRSTS